MEEKCVRKTDRILYCARLWEELKTGKRFYLVSPGKILSMSEQEYKFINFCPFCGEKIYFKSKD